MIHSDKKRQRRNTLILIASFMAAIAVLYLVLYVIRGRNVPDSGLTVVIQINGEKVCTMDLDEDAEYMAKTGDGHYNDVIVKDQSVMVGSADCENQICVKTGAIRYPGEVIACLPHSLIIYILAGD